MKKPCILAVLLLLVCAGCEKALNAQRFERNIPYNAAHELFALLDETPSPSPDNDPEIGCLTQEWPIEIDMDLVYSEPDLIRIILPPDKVVYDIRKERVFHNSNGGIYWSGTTSDPYVSLSFTVHKEYSASFGAIRVYGPPKGYQFYGLWSGGGRGNLLQQQLDFDCKVEI